MARLDRRAAQGERCRAAIPRGHGKTTACTAAARSRAAPFGLDGAMDGAAFRADVEQLLVREPTPGAVGAMDHLPAIR
jgi:hypothetical protein